MNLISVVVPCYNEQEALPFFYQEIIKIAALMSDKAEFEFLFVNDGSRDDTLHICQDFAKGDERVQYVSFSRNFGKEAALYAGLENAKGDFVVIMDADLQDPPNLIVEMFDALQNAKEFDCVATRRVTRDGEPLIRSIFARLFYKLINKISRVEIVDGARDFRMMTRKMVDAIISMKEYNRFSKGLFAWVGFKTKWLEYINTERIAGSTKWSFFSLFLYAIQGIISFSIVPLALASILGFVFCSIAFVLICIIIAKTLLWGDPVSGWPSLACFVLFMFGVQLFCTGILGQYVANIYLESKNRPIYIVGDTNIKRRDI